MYPSAEPTTTVDLVDYDLYIISQALSSTAETFLDTPVNTQEEVDYQALFLVTMATLSTYVKAAREDLRITGDASHALELTDYEREVLDRVFEKMVAPHIDPEALFALREHILCPTSAPS
jgi:hypothetical protein